MEAEIQILQVIYSSLFSLFDEGFFLFLQRNFLTKKGILAPIKGKAKGLPHLVTDHERHKLAVAA